MSLLSPRNFAAPFTHKASLITLALVVLLFAIMRLTINASSSAPIRILPELRDERSAVGSTTIAVPARAANSDSKPRAAQGGALEGRASAAFFEARTAPEAKSPSAPPAFSDSDVLGEILGSSGGTQAAAEQPKNAPRSDQLDSIEQKLGLR